MSLWNEGLKSLNIKGSWDADSNTPTLGNSGAGGNSGDFYIVSKDGSTSIDGMNVWEIGDWIVNYGTTWGKIDNASVVSSVAGKTGIVTLVKADVSDFTEGDYIHTTGNENVDGVKAFASLPTIPVTPLADENPASKKYQDDAVALLVSAIGAKADDSAVVHLSGSETITGDKILSGTTKAGDAVGGHYTQIDPTTGRMIALGNARAWKDIMVSAFALGAGANAPTIQTILGSGSIRSFGFTGTGSQVNEMHGQMEMQHDWVEGTNISMHVHWMPAVSAVGTVRWNLEYSIKQPSGVFSAPTTINLDAVSAGTAWTHQLSAFADILGAGLSIGSVIVFRLYRNPADAADTYTSNAVLLQIGMHYLSDTLGSRQITTK